MAPQFPSGGASNRNCLDGSFCNDPAPSSSTNPTSPLNMPLLGLGLGLAFFLSICLILCVCTYRNAKARNRSSSSRELERGTYIGLGLSVPEQITLQDGDEDTKLNEQDPPAYTPKVSLSPARPTRRSQHETSASMPSPLLVLTPSPALATPLSPALSTRALSPTLGQGEGEEVRLLDAGLGRALTPPPPMYVR